MHAPCYLSRLLDSTCLPGSTGKRGIRNHDIVVFLTFLPQLKPSFNKWMVVKSGRTIRRSTRATRARSQSIKVYRFRRKVYRIVCLGLALSLSISQSAFDIPSAIDK